MTVQTKKSLGQHWLDDTFSLEAMCRTGEVNADDVVLEVGPGPGALTRMLVEKAKKVIAVELDESLAQNLASNLGNPSNLNVVQQSILDFDLSLLSSDYKVIANIPYYLTSKLVQKLLTADNSPMLTVLLVQKEVAERIAAAPGKTSLLSISAQFYADVSIHEVVPAALFAPPPKVDSQIVRLRRREVLPLDVEEKAFFRLVKAGFMERRKKLKSSLAGGLRMEKSEVLDVLTEAGIGDGVRAQELSIQQWGALYTRLKDR